MDKRSYKEMGNGQKGGEDVSRLIDADYITEGRVSNDPVVIAANCAPTIDAIPVEWLEEHDSEGNEYGRRYITVVEALSIWQEEQEAR